jgi:hypothetical protein
MRPRSLGLLSAAAVCVGVGCLLYGICSKSSDETPVTQRGQTRKGSSRPLVEFIGKEAASKLALPPAYLAVKLRTHPSRTVASFFRSYVNCHVNIYLEQPNSQVTFLVEKAFVLADEFEEPADGDRRPNILLTVAVTSADAAKLLIVENADTLHAVLPSFKGTPLE